MVDAQQPTNIESRLIDSPKETPDLIQEQQDLEKLNAIVRTVKGTNEHLSSLHSAIIKQTLLLEKQQKVDNKKESDKEFQDIKSAHTEEKKAYDKRLEEKYKNESERHSKIHAISSSISLKSKALMNKVVSPIQSMAEKGLNGVNNKGWCDICSHISKGLRWFKNKAGGGILSLLVGSVKAIWKGITWVYSVGKKVISWMWDKFVMLAKVGWKVLSTVWDIVTTPVNFIWDIFKTVLMSFLTNPIGLVILGIGLFFAARYIIRSIWPAASEFFISLFKGVWGYLEKFVANVFTKGDVPALRKNIDGFFTGVYEWVFGKDGKGGVIQYVFSLYDEYIGSETGFTTEFISTVVVNTVSSMWNSIKDFFHKLYSSDIKEEMNIVWIMIQDIYYAAKTYLIEDSLEQAKLDLKNGNDELSQKRLDAEIGKLNLEKIKNFSSSISDNFVRNKLIYELGKKYLNLSLQQDKSNIRNDLTMYGEKVLSKMREDFSGDIDFSSFIFGDKTFKEDINNIISSIMIENDANVLDMIRSSEKELQIDTLMINDIIKANESGDQNKLTNLLLKIGTGKTESIRNEYKILSDSVTSITAKNLNTLKYYSLLHTHRVLALLKYNKMLSEEESKIIETRLEFISQIPKNKQEEWKTISENMALSETEKIEKLKNSIKEMNASFKKKLPDSDIDSFIKMILSPSIQTNISTAMLGGVFNFASFAIIGEGDVPEVVLPINKNGIEFALNATEVLIDKIFNESSKTIDNSDNQNEVMVSQQRVRKAIAPKDKKLYDLKNIASSISTFG